jgi:hypothetical protein
MNTMSDMRQMLKSPSCDDLFQVNTNLIKDQSVIIKAWTKAVELTTKYLEGQQAVEVAKVLGR